MKTIKLFFILLPIFSLVMFFRTPIVHAAISYGSGVYTNLCGSGFTALANLCNKGCNPSSGTCSISNPYVVKWTCDGRLNECRNNESSWSTNQSLSGTACGKTVQLDVFTKNCRVGGGWTCGDSDLKDYMVWSSGDCPATTQTPTLTPTPISYRSSCDQLSVVSGNNSTVPVTVTLRGRGYDSRGSIQSYKFYFGDGEQLETVNAEVTHRYESSGDFRARVDVKNSGGAWMTSGSCETTVTVRSLPVESHKSDCSDLYILEGNYTKPPVTAKFQVTGYDNKKALQGYKMDFGLGSTKETSDGHFEQLYDKSGTYTVRGYVKDSEGNWKGGSGSCQKTFYVNTAPLTSQPKTGTPTTYTLLSLLSGVIGVGLLGIAQKMAR
jgi:PKD domain